MKNRIDEAKEKYQELFPTDKEKAEAFDKIASEYYYLNFGMMPKANLDVLMFSIYIEQILEKYGYEKFKEYSDYSLSKDLGITQTKVSNLKVKKELLYPYEGYDWKKSFALISKNAVYEDRKIKLWIPDKNLYLELKNAIEENGGFIEVQLNSNLLQVRLPYFIDLLITVSDEKSRDELIKEIKRQINEKDIEVEMIERQSFGKALLQQGPDCILDLIGDCIPILGGPVKSIANNILKAVKKSI